jgi:hypothetical protein
VKRSRRRLRRSRVRFSVRDRPLLLRFLRGFNHFECEQSDNEYDNDQDSLGSRLPSDIVIHETPNTQNCRAKVWNWNRILVHSDNLGARDHCEGAPAPTVPRVLNSVGVTLRHERISIATCNPVDDSVHHKIIGLTDVRAENDNRPCWGRACDYGRRILATDDDQRANRQHAIVHRTHTSRGDNQNRILGVES